MTSQEKNIGEIATENSVVARTIGKTSPLFIEPGQIKRWIPFLERFQAATSLNSQELIAFTTATQRIQSYVDGSDIYSPFTLPISLVYKIAKTSAERLKVANAQQQEIENNEGENTEEVLKNKLTAAQGLHEFFRLLADTGRQYLPSMQSNPYNEYADEAATMQDYSESNRELLEAKAIAHGYLALRAFYFLYTNARLPMVQAEAFDQLQSLILHDSEKENKKIAFSTIMQEHSSLTTLDISTQPTQKIETTRRQM